MKLREIYKTRDLYAAAFIYAQLSGSFVGLEPDGRDFLFVFRDEQVCEQLANSYYAQRANVNAKNYADAIRTMKDLVFAGLRKARL